MCWADTQSTAKALKTELTLEPPLRRQNTTWGMSLTKYTAYENKQTKINVLQRILIHPESHNMIVKIPQYNSKLLDSQKKQQRENLLNSRRKRASTDTKPKTIQLLEL